MLRSGISKLAFLVTGLALVFTIAAPAADAAAQGIRARVDEPFEVQGRLFPHGEISIRERSEYNPTLSLNEVCVDGESLGLLVAEISTSGAPSDEPALFFEREADGHLVLVGYAHRGGSAAQRMYTFREEDRLPTLSAAEVRPDGDRGLL